MIISHLNSVMGNQLVTQLHATLNKRIGKQY